MERAERDTQGGVPARLALRDGRMVRIRPTASIESIEADGNYVLVHAGDEVIRHRSTLSAMRRRLGNGPFMQVHRTVLINVEHVDHLEFVPQKHYFMATMRSGRRGRCTRAYGGELLDHLGRVRT